MPGFSLTRATTALALVALGGCATVGASNPSSQQSAADASSAEAAAPGHWQRIRDSLTAQAIADQRGPRVSVDASYNTFGGVRRVRASFRMRDDGYVLVAHVDADGRLRILFPKDPRDDGFVEGGRSYSIPEFDAGFQNSYAFARYASNMRYRPYSQRVDSYDGGTGYVFVVASWRPMQFDRIVENGRWASYELADAYSVTDPRDAVNEFAALIAGDGREVYSVEYANYFRSNLLTQGFASSGFRNAYCETGYSGLFDLTPYGDGFGYYGNYWNVLVPVGGGWFYVPISDPFSGCTSYNLAYLGVQRPTVIWPVRDTSATGVIRPRMRPTGPRDSSAAVVEHRQVAASSERMMSARDLAPRDAFTPQPDYRARGLITAQGSSGPRSPDLSGRGRATPALRLGDPRPGVTDMVLRSHDRGDAPIAPPSRPRDVGRQRWGSSPDMPVMREPRAVDRSPRSAPRSTEPTHAAPRSAPTHAEPREMTPRTMQPPSSGGTRAAPPPPPPQHQAPPPSSPRAANERPASPHH